MCWGFIKILKIELAEGDCMNDDVKRQNRPLDTPFVGCFGVLCFVLNFT